MVDDDDSDGSPSPEPRTDSRSALLREFRAWWRLRIVKRDESFSMIFFTRTRIYGVGVEVGGPSGGPRGRGAPSDLVGSLDLHQPKLQLYIFSFREKKSKRRIHRVLRYGAAAKP